AGLPRARNPSSTRSDLRLTRQSESALGDDVLLDLRGAAADDQAQREERVRLPETALALVLRVVVETAELAHHVERECGDVEAELAVLELHDEPRDARRFAAQTTREQPHAVVLHRERARLEAHQAVAVDGARERGNSVRRLLLHEAHQPQPEPLRIRIQ